MEITSREKVLKSVRNALISKTVAPFQNVDADAAIYVENQSPYIDVVFAEEFTKVGGQFVYCENENELIENFSVLVKQRNFKNIFCADNEIKELLTLSKTEYTDEPEDLHIAEASVTFCESIIARFGSIMMSSAQSSGRRGFIYAPTHIVLAFTSQIVMDIKEAFSTIKSKYNNKTPSMITFITGPSRTADIEKTLVMGAHGPKELIVFLIENRTS